MDCYSQYGLEDILSAWLLAMVECVEMKETKVVPAGRGEAAKVGRLSKVHARGSGCLLLGPSRYHNVQIEVPPSDVCLRK